MDILYKFNKHIQNKHNEKLFEVLCLHLNTVIVSYNLHGNEKLLEFFVYPSDSRNLLTENESLIP